MSALTLKKAKQIIAGARAKADEMKLKPMTFLIVDDGGFVKAVERGDGAPNLGFDIAFGKAYPTVHFRRSSRESGERAAANPAIVPSFLAMTGGRYLPVPGAVMIVDKKGEVIGAAAATGDTGDNDEIAIIAGVEAAGFAHKLA
jgi:uncharacterized protein GlcG (DUF336 family)